MAALIVSKIAYVLGIFNVIGLFLVLFSCRCNSYMPLRLRQSKAYQKFFNYHCYYWWFFIASVLLHAVFAITAYGNPFTG